MRTVVLSDDSGSSTLDPLGFPGGHQLQQKGRLTHSDCLLDLQCLLTCSGTYSPSMCLLSVCTKSVKSQGLNAACGVAQSLLGSVTGLLQTPSKHMPGLWIPLCVVLQQMARLQSCGGILLVC